MDGTVDDAGIGRRAMTKPTLRMSKTYLGCRMVRQLDGTVKVWAPVWGQSPPRWDLVKVASSMKSAHNFVHNTRAKKG
jgi:hypothetical protein